MAEPTTPDAAASAPVPPAGREDRSAEPTPVMSMPAPRAPGNEAPPPAPSSSSSRVRSRLVRFGTRPSSGSPVLEPLLVAVRANQPRADVSLLERAYATAEEAHRGQTRKSGDPSPWRPSSRTSG
jgi:GTP pyrophosphokinase